jgi:hypothetical protein
VNVRFLTVAQQEVDEAFIWFDEQTDHSLLYGVNDEQLLILQWPILTANRATGSIASAN